MIDLAGLDQRAGGSPILFSRGIAAHTGYGAYGT
jgi:hypothetical protein